MDVLAAYREVGSYRGAAVICGTTHKTVRRIVEAQEAGGVKSERIGRGHNYDEVVGLVAEKVASSKGRISAKRLLPAAQSPSTRRLLPLFPSQIRDFLQQLSRTT